MTDRFGAELKVGERVLIPYSYQSEGVLREGKITSILENDYDSKVFVDHEWTLESNIISLEIYRELRPEYFL